MYMQHVLRRGFWNSCVWTTEKTQLRMRISFHHNAEKQDKLEGVSGWPLEWGYAMNLQCSMN